MVWACELLVALCCFRLAVTSAPPGSGWSSASAPDYTSRYSGPVAVPVVLPDGTLANTPEVAAARSQHLAALNKAKALWYGSGGSGYSGHSGSSGASTGWSSGGSSVWPSGASSGWPSGTSSGRSSGGSSGWPSGASSAWPSSASSGWSSGASSGWPSGTSSGRSSGGSSGWPSGASYGWTGPQASPSVLPSGHLADTPTVAAARAAHLVAIARANQEAEKWKPQGHGWS